MLARHSLVWLHPDGWREAESSSSADCRDVINQWRKADWPLIARRPDADAGSSECCLGLAPPPDPGSGSKRRIGLRVSHGQVRQVEAPVSLAKTIDAAPREWRPHLSRLSQQADSAGLTLRVFGSLALQALTGQPYLTSTSDIDIVFAPSSMRQLDEGVRLLDTAAGQLPLDGELVFPNGQAVAWKEWSNAVQAGEGMRVLTKDMHGVRLAKTTELRARLGAS